MNDKLCTKRNIVALFASLYDYGAATQTLDNLLFIIFRGWAVDIRIISDWRIELKQKKAKNSKLKSKKFVGPKHQPHCSNV